MFKSWLRKIWNKVKDGEAVSFVEKVVLWANSVGLFGVLWGVIAIACFILSAGKGAFLGIINYWDGFLITGTVFVVKNWNPIIQIATKNWHKLFPKDIVDK